MMGLPKQRIDQIERKAEDVLLSAYPSSHDVVPPVDVARIAKGLGLVLKSGAFKREEVAGAYDRNKKTIYVADADPYPRKVFTIAHELGHHFLHDHKQQETFYRIDAVKFGEKKEVDETEANWFAASLLMPRDLLVRYWATVKDIEQLANIFGVSNSAMEWRLKNLDLIDF